MLVLRDKIYRRNGRFAWQYCYTLRGNVDHACETLAQVKEIAKRLYGVKPANLQIQDI